MHNSKFNKIEIVTLKITDKWLLQCHLKKVVPLKPFAIFSPMVNLNNLNFLGRCPTIFLHVH